MADENNRESQDSPFNALSFGGHRIKQEERESYGSYLFGPAYNEDPWAEEKKNKLPWSASTQGRTVIRLFSRGVMGAGFYTLGRMSIERYLDGNISKVFDEELGELVQTGSREGYSVHQSWSEIGFNPLRLIAKSFDIVFGGIISSSIRFIEHDPDKAAEAIDGALNFRRKSYFGVQDAAGELVLGRSLGHEMVGMTFDFAMGSMGDAWGRNLANLADPNTPKPWRDKDGHFSLTHMAAATAKSGWRILSKNQGEDWAAALPYVYQMKFQRQAINHLYPGFKVLSDKSLQSSVRIDSEGAIVGSYAKAGAMDLQFRFMGYNWYTLMFRDLYDKVGTGFAEWKDNHFQLPQVHIEHNPITAAVHGLGYTTRYVAKSFIKSMIYMAPAVPFFWMFRVPQSKPNGIAININTADHDKGGVLYTHQVPGGHKSDVELAEYNSLFASARNPIPEDGKGWIRGQTAVDADHLKVGDRRDVFRSERTYGLFDSILNPFGRISYDVGHVLGETVNGLGGFLHGGYAGDAKLQAEVAKNMHIYADAAMAYTPYMIAKAETALKWDNKTMDNAIYKMLDGVTELNLGKAKGGLSDIRDVVLHPPATRHTGDGTPEEKAELNEVRQEHNQIATNQAPTKPESKKGTPKAEQGKPTNKPAQQPAEENGKPTQATKETQPSTSIDAKESSHERIVLKEKDKDKKVDGWVAKESLRQKTDKSAVPPGTVIH